VAVYDTTPVEPDDTRSGFRSGVRALDDYFSRHANENEASGVGRTYALRRGATEDPALPRVLGFYTLSMALIESTQATAVLRTKLPRYPLLSPWSGVWRSTSARVGKDVASGCCWTRFVGLSTSPITSGASA
jgi:hypothetical protein